MDFYTSCGIRCEGIVRGQEGWIETRSREELSLFALEAKLLNMYAYGAYDILCNDDWCAVAVYSQFTSNKSLRLSGFCHLLNTWSAAFRSLLNFLRVSLNLLKFVYSLSIRINQLDQRNRLYARFAFGCSARTIYSVDASGLSG